ncbi:MAG: GtrA family protein [Bacteroidales bacterium]|nr:GtrA family protein [Bacteroidales bacterium]
MDLIWKFIKFGIVGFSGMIVDYAFLILFVEVFHWPDLVANACSFTLAASSNYLLNRIWTFRSHDKQVGREYLKFFLVSLVGLGISTLTIFLFERALPGWSAEAGNGFRFIIFIKYFYLLKFIAIVITTIWNFFGNLLFTFREKDSNNNPV